MAKASELLEQTAKTRDLARRARRLAHTLPFSDQDRLLRHADELERQATELEQQTVAPPVVQVQTQVQQQQQETGPPAADPKDHKPKS